MGTTAYSAPLPPCLSKSSSNSFALVARVFAPSASPEFNASRACCQKLRILLICVRCLLSICAGIVSNRFSMEAIKSAASCWACGFAAPPAVSSPMAAVSVIGCGVSASAGEVTAGLGATCRRSRLGEAAAAATGMGGISTSGGDRRGALAGWGTATRGTGANTGGSTGTCGRRCRHPPSAHAMAAHTAAVAHLRVKSPYTFKRALPSAFDWSPLLLSCGPPPLLRMQWAIAV